MTKKINPKIKQLLRILNDQAFHDGSSLGNELGVSRAAIWKFIAQLQQYGVAIESVKAKGYRLAQPIELLDLEEIKKYIKDPVLKNAIQLEIFSEIDSTNNFLYSQHLETTNFQVCLAEMQNSGRGRLNRQWFSPFGLNLYFSCLYEFKKDIGELGGLSLLVSLCIVKTLENFNLSSGIKIKWPNDILFEEKKLAGILIEIIAETNGNAKAVIGIGINVNMGDDLLKTIDKPCTSLKVASQKNIDRNQLAAILITHLHQELTRFSHMNFLEWKNIWEKYDYLRDKKINIINGKQTIIGTALGINEKGFLLLKHDDGIIKAYSSGDTSIIKYE